MTVLDEIRRLVTEDPTSVDAGDWIGDPRRRSTALGEEELAREVFDDPRSQGRRRHDVEDALVVTRDWLRRWVRGDGRTHAAPRRVPEGTSRSRSWTTATRAGTGRRPTSATTSRASRRSATWSGTSDLSFHGPQDLVDLLDQLRGRVRPEMQRDGIAADVDVITVDRDASMYKEVPPDTWTLAFGWFMHAIFEHALRLPLPSQPAADLRVLPLQQARPADA